MCIEKITEKQENFITNLKSLMNDYDNIVATLDKEIQTINMSISDAYHYIDLNDLNACSGYKAYKELQGRLRERRRLKNNIEYLDAVYSEMGSMKEIIGSLDKKFADRTYTPRVNDELFMMEKDKISNRDKYHQSFGNVEEVGKFLQDNGYIVQVNKTVTSHIKRAIIEKRKYCGFSVREVEPGKILLDK